jgi:2,4-dienoyl-CoA reductase-like NADH-dependent reductase (Old Yellow Enzyme family)
MLFEPLEIKGITLRNRYVMPPMANNMGVVSGQAIAFYRERAKGGVGLVIVEATHLDRFNDEHFTKGLKHLTKAVHDEGAAIAIQLYQNDIFDSEESHPTSVTRDQIDRLKKKYVRAARIAREEFFDGVEPHGAHGYFLNQFFSSEHNRRTDEYGGSLENRMRLGLEVVEAIREGTDENTLLLYRHTPVRAGYTLDESIQFAKALEKAGVDIMDISPSTDPMGEHAGLAGTIKSHLKIPMIAVGGMENLSNAQKALSDGKCDLVAVGKNLISDPELPKKIFEGRFDDIVACTNCGEGCHANLKKGVPIACTQNPNVGREYLSASS